VDDAAQVEATLAISVPGGGCSPVEAAAAISVLGGVSGRSMRSCGGGVCDPCAGRRMRLWSRRRVRSLCRAEDAFVEAASSGAG
jgi:hypothetical protein